MLQKPGITRCRRRWGILSLSSFRGSTTERPTSVINAQLTVSKHACPTHGRSDHLDSFRSTREPMRCIRKRTAGTQIDHPPTLHQHSQASRSSRQLEEDIRNHFAGSHWRLSDGHRRRGQTESEAKRCGKAEACGPFGKRRSAQIVRCTPMRRGRVRARDPLAPSIVDPTQRFAVGQAWKRSTHSCWEDKQSSNSRQCTTTQRPPRTIRDGLTFDV